MTKVLILNHQHIECGVYQFGLRVYKLASKSNKIDYHYRIVSNHEEYLKALEDVKPDFTIYNWHWDRMPWLTESDITENRTTKHYFIYHDGSMMRVYDKYLVFGAMPPDVSVFQSDKVVLMPRPLYEYTGGYSHNSVPTIGSFGFAFNHKKFHELAPFVGKYFKEARVHIHLTNPYFGDTPGNKLQDIIALCYRTKPDNVDLRITSNFTDDDTLLYLLADNDLNLFMYDINLQNPGISSAIDYALSVERPIAVSNNMMFRHIMSDEIRIDKTPLNKILEQGTKPLERFYDIWSTDNFRLQMDNLFL